MQVLVAVSCLLAVASAGFVSPYSYPYVAVHDQHIPVIGPNGVPVDEPAVAHARAEHATAHIEAHARNGNVAVVASHYAAPVAIAAPVAYAAHYGYAGPIHVPTIGANGVPVDEPAVQLARANHAAAHVEAKVRNGDAAFIAAAPVVAAHYDYAGYDHVAVDAHHIPSDTVEVAAAKAAHFAAHVEAKARNGIYHHYAPLVHYRKRRGVFGYAAPVAHYSHYAGAQHLPVIGANGVPVDEPAVQIARASHAAAHVEAEVRNGDAAIVAVTHYAAAPVAYAAHHIAAPFHAVYAGPQHLPVIGANGVPVDEPAVQVARAHHAASHVEAKVRNGDAAIVAATHYAAAPYVASPYVHHHVAIDAHHIPADTPEVAAAKVAHYAAHVEAKVRNGDLYHVVPVVHAY